MISPKSPRPYEDRYSSGPLWERPPSRAKTVAGRVAWASIPVLSIGLLAFIPSLRLAIRKQTPVAWLAFVGFLAATVAEIVIVETAKPAANGDTDPGSLAGGYFFALMIVGAIHAWIAGRGQTGRRARVRPPYTYFRRR